MAATIVTAAVATNRRRDTRRTEGGYWVDTVVATPEPAVCARKLAPTARRDKVGGGVIANGGHGFGCSERAFALEGLISMATSKLGVILQCR